MKVKDFMTLNPRTIHPDTGVKTAFRIMKKGGFKQLPVVDEDELLGIVTDRNIRRPDIVDDDQDWSTLYRLDNDFRVRGIMTTKIMAVSPNDSLQKACKILQKKNFNALPVVSDEGVLVGILTIHDLIEPLLKFLDSEAD